MNRGCDLPGGLEAAALRLGVRLEDEQQRQLEAFVGLLEQWNARFNLLSRQDVGRIWTRHVLDSLSLLPLLPAGRVLDVGTGAGFPGLPLAIAAPERAVHLVDRNARKIRFLELAVHKLGVLNTSCVCADVMELPQHETFGAIVSRAVADPVTLWASTRCLLAPQGRLVLMTGAGGDTRPVGDAQPVFEGGRIERRCEIEIPGLDRPHEVTIIAGCG